MRSRALLLALLMLFAVGVPVALGLSLDRRLGGRLLPAAARLLGSDLAIGRLAFRPLGTAHLSDLRFLHRQIGGPLARVSTVSVDLDPRELLRGELRVVRIHLDQPRIDLGCEADHLSELRRRFDALVGHSRRSAADVSSGGLSAGDRRPAPLPATGSSARMPVPADGNSAAGAGGQGPVPADTGFELTADNGRLLLGCGRLQAGLALRADKLAVRGRSTALRLSAGPLRVSSLGIGEAIFERAAVDLVHSQVRRLLAVKGRLITAQRQPILESVTASGATASGGLGFRLTAAAPGRSTDDLRLSGVFSPQRLAVALEADDLPLAALASMWPGWGLDLAASRGRVRAQLDLVGDRLQAKVGLGLTDVSFESRLLAGRPTFLPVVELELRTTASPRQRWMVIEQSRLQVGEIVVQLRGRAERLAQRPRIEVVVDAPETPCAAVLRSLPPGLAPALEGLGLDGDLSLHASLVVDTARPSDLALEVDFGGPGCDVLSDPPAAPMASLARAYDHYVREPSGRLRPFPLDERNQDFRRLGSLPRFVPGAFLTTEDWNFYRHRGFEWEPMRVALAHDLAAGRFERGGSTITQQLVKNLFLGRERALGRKLEEAVLAWRMEQLVSKRRILEAYLNVIELGPSVFGIRQAARYYFDREPEDLTPLQAAHLAAIAPGPYLYAKRFREGEVGEEWMAHLGNVLRVMQRRGMLSRAQVERALRTPLGLRPR